MDWRVHTPEAFPHDIEDTMVGKTVERVDAEVENGEATVYLDTTFSKITIHLTDGSKMEITTKGGLLTCDVFR